MEKRTMYLLFVFQTYGKFQIILQVHFIKHKPHISEEKLVPTLATRETRSN